MRVHLKRFSAILFILSLLFAFSVRISPSASAADTVIPKILTTISATPVALVDPSTITAATSTPGLSVTSAGWFDASGKAVNSAFNPETYKIEIHVKADDGYVIAPDVAAYLNNSAVTINVDSSQKTATIVREYTAAVWAPTIIKNPTAETVDEGGWASFAVSANYARDYEWFLEDPNRQQAISVSDLKLVYQGMSATGDGSTKMNLYNIPYELNGWKVVCNFIGAGTNNSVKSQGALLTVIPSASRLAAMQEASANAAAATAQPVEADPAEPVADTDAEISSSDPVEEENAVAFAPEEEVPSSVPVPVYSDAWSSDARGHWHASETAGDDSRAQEALHSFTWYEAEDGTQTGVCDVCGYTLTRKPAAAASGDGAGSNSASDKASASPVDESNRVKPSAVMVLLMALAPIDAALIAAHAVRGRKAVRSAR